VGLLHGAVRCGPGLGSRQPAVVIGHLPQLAPLLQCLGEHGACGLEIEVQRPRVGAISPTSQDDIISGTGRCEGLDATVRLSGAADLSAFPAQVTFDGLFAVKAN
jgi:hypothetical protein